MKTIKLKSAFGMTSIVILFFAANGYFIHPSFYIPAGIFLMMLPACSTKY